MPYILFALSLLLATCTAPPDGVWIGIRQDGLPGSGTRHDPYDGSTPERFDAILGKYWKSGVEGLKVNILPGTYRTLGNSGYIPGLRDPGDGWRCRSGWTIRGAGMDKTILVLHRIHKHPSEDIYGGVVIATTDSSVERVLVEDLTVNCNHDQIGNAKSTEAGVSLGGSRHTIRRVRVENVAGLGHEGFPIGIGCWGRDSSRNLIENCHIRGWKGGAGGSITIANNNNNGREPISYTSGTIQNNLVEGTHIAYGGWAMRNVIFRNNKAKDCAYGVNIDSWNNENVLFENNSFIDCSNYGFVFYNCHRFTLRGNRVRLAGPGTFVVLLGNDSDIDVISNSFTVRSNQKASLVERRNPETLKGRFHFENNQTSPGVSVNDF